MTTVSQIITDAYRVSNLQAIGTTPTTAQQDEALRYLNRLVKSVFGNEAGEQLSPFPIGRNNISRPNGYPSYGQSPGTDWFVPQNQRLMCNLTESLTLYLPPNPDDGARFGVVDSSDNFSTYNLIVVANGRTIEGATSVTLSTDGETGEWFYRADLGEWVKYSPLLIDGTFPFPEEFDDFFVTMLAIRINPAYGRTMDEQTGFIMRRSKSQLQARYQNHIEVNSEIGLLRLSRLAYDRDLWANGWGFDDPNAAFDRGYFW